MDTKKRILLIYPKLGPYDSIVRDMPLSLIYAARIAQRHGFSITIIDQRIQVDWQRAIKEELDKRPLLVGLSVMTGKPIQYALEVSKFIRERSDIPIVWGGIHPTIMPDQTLENQYIDIVVKGDGEITLYELADLFYRKDIDMSSVKGIAFKKNFRIIHTEERPRIDMSNMPLPDYDLVNFNDYIRFGNSERFFSLLTSIGCPHRCAYCYNVSLNTKKWQSDSIGRTIDHLSLIMDKYKPTYISVIDSDFFVNPKRVCEFFNAIEQKGWKVRFGFRGVRVDEMVRADDRLLLLMERVGVKNLHIGAESGSQKMLDLMHKNIKVEQTIEVNRRLKNFPTIVPTYNFFSGIPGETEEDIKCSTDLIMRLIKENPNCLITAYNQFTPYPGTGLFDLAIKHGLKAPQKLDDWINFDQSDFATNSPWLTKDRKKLLDMLYITTIFIDGKITSLFTSKSLKYKIVRIIALLYRQVARFRLKHHITIFLIEGKLKSKFI